MFSVVGGAAVVPFLARRLQIPSSVLEIIYGILLFHTIIKDQPDWFRLLRELGIIYLMFIAGMELDLHNLKRQRRTLWYILIPLLSLVSMPFLFVYMGLSYYTGITVAVISAGIAIPILKEYELMDTSLGRDIVGIALSGELLSILALTGLDIYHRFGIRLEALWEGGKLLVMFALAGLFLRILYIIAWWHPERVEKVMESEDPVEEGIRIVISIAFAGALIAYLSGVEPILGSFLVGVIFSYVFKSKGRFEEKINAVGFGFFIPFFFIGVGSDLDLNLFFDLKRLLLSAFFTLMIFASNIFPLLFARLMRISNTEALAIALILSAPLSLMVVTGTLGIRMGVISHETYNSIIISALVASITYPTVFRFLQKSLSHENEQEG